MSKVSNAIDYGMLGIGHILGEGSIFGFNNGSSYIGFNINKIYINELWKSGKLSDVIEKRSICEFTACGKTCGKLKDC